MVGIPKEVKIREVGPREGFQILPFVVETEKKLELLNGLAMTGVSYIEACSFVRPDLVPQHADAEEVVSRLSIPNLFGVLCLNQFGFKKAKSYPNLVIEPWIHTSVCEEFLIKNSGKDFKKERETFSGWNELFKDFSGIKLMVSMSFGSPKLGIVKPEEAFSRIKDIALDFNIEEVCLADTIGVGTPNQVSKLVELCFTKFKNVSLHLHDTNGVGIANAYAGLLLGVNTFESSIGGLGGCPFTKGASGNIATEELLFLLDGLGVKTGISLKAYRDLLPLVASITKKELKSSFYR